MIRHRENVTIIATFMYVYYLCTVTFPFLCIALPFSDYRKKSEMGQHWHPRLIPQPRLRSRYPVFCDSYLHSCRSMCHLCRHEANVGLHPAVRRHRFSGYFDGTTLQGNNIVIPQSVADTHAPRVAHASQGWGLSSLQCYGEPIKLGKPLTSIPCFRPHCDRHHRTTTGG